ncbi:MAG: YraN family protein [Vicinamibacterales bacterium]
MPPDHRQTLGKWGEDLACAELQRRGYAILARRYRTRAGEIDIIARDGPTIVFVEVKTRSDPRFGGGAAAVTPWKQRRIAHMALDFLSRARWTEKPCRFDVVVVDRDPDKVQVDIFTNAFAVSSASPYV